MSPRHEGADKPLVNAPRMERSKLRDATAPPGQLGERNLEEPSTDENGPRILKELRHDLDRIVLVNLNQVGMYVSALMPKVRREIGTSVKEVFDSVSYLVGKGLVARKGDGFGVLYSLTDEGLTEQYRISSRQARSADQGKVSMNGA